MTKPGHRFSRVILGLQPRASDLAMECAAELAGLLDLELLGLFVEDSALRRLASSPFAREFRPLNGGWHPLSLERLSSDLDLAARSSERMFVGAAGRLSTRCRFEVVRGATAEAVASVSRREDIMIVGEPWSATEYAGAQLSWLKDAALRSAAAVMLVPRHIIRRSGPVVVVAAGGGDPSVAVAAAIAKATGEALAVLRIEVGPEDDAPLSALAASGLVVRRIGSGVVQRPDAALLAVSLSHSGERLIVATRGVIGENDATELMARRQVPVLLIEPSEQEAAEHTANLVTGTS